MEAFKKGGERGPYGAFPVNGDANQSLLASRPQPGLISAALCPLYCDKVEDIRWCMSGLYTVLGEQ